jgi:hypothetical protein
MTLAEWISAVYERNAPDLLYRKGGHAQMSFFGRQIASLFVSPNVGHEQFLVFPNVAGTHTSKSVLLPVYELAVPGLRIVARNNFHNWNVTVISDRKIVLPEYFEIDSANRYLFMEGMEEHRRGPYSANACEFSFATWNDYELYAIMRCIASQSEKFNPAPQEQ